MARERFSTTIESTLLALARQKAEAEGFAGVNAVIERALQLYFANCAVEVWEKPLQGGWLKKLTIRQDKVVLENIRSRHIRRKGQSRYYTPDFLTADGWRQTWQLPKT